MPKSETLDQRAAELHELIEDLMRLIETIPAAVVTQELDSVVSTRKYIGIANTETYTEYLIQIDQI